MDQCTHEVRAEYWKRIIRACGQRPAGQSAKSWMEENGICASFSAAGQQGSSTKEMSVVSASAGTVTSDRFIGADAFICP